MLHLQGEMVAVDLVKQLLVTSGDAGRKFQIGTKLIQRAMQWFREQRCEYIEVPTDQNNIAAIRAYEAAGFRVIYCGMILSQKLEY